MDKKVEILKKIIDSGKISLSELIDGYREFYTYELQNKKHVVSSIEDALTAITQYLLCKK